MEIPLSILSLLDFQIFSFIPALPAPKLPFTESSSTPQPSINISPFPEHVGNFSVNFLPSSLYLLGVSSV